MCYFIFILKILLTLLYAMKTIQKIWCLLPFAEVYVSRVILSLLFPLILIIPSHPLDIDQPEIYPYKEGISRIRWDILDAESTRDYDNAEIRKACMAECITLNTVPVKDFAYLYVYNKKAKEKLQNCLNYTPTVDIQVNPFMFP